jgi:hypothetical protein
VDRNEAVRYSDVPKNASSPLRGSYWRIADRYLSLKKTADYEAHKHQLWQDDTLQIAALLRTSGPVIHSDPWKSRVATNFHRLCFSFPASCV